MSQSPEASSLAEPPRRKQCACGATVHEGARFCWMCGAPVNQRLTPMLVISDDDAANSATTAANHRERLRDLHLAAWLAVPLSLAVVFGVYLVEPAYAVLVGPALVLGTLAAVLHGALTHQAATPKTTAQRGAVVGSSIAMGAVTFAGTFALTMLIAIIVVVVMIISFCAGIMELCGIK